MSQEYISKINTTKNISENDKIILIEAFTKNDVSLFKNLSFYSNKYSNHTLGDYSYLKTNENEDIFITQINNGIEQVILDSEKKIIFDSRWWYSPNCGVPSFIDHISMFYNEVYENLNFDDTYDAGKDVIAIQYWFNTYGHFMDEILNIYDFNNKISYSNHFKILRSYPEGEYFKNYKIITDTLFGENYIKNYGKMVKLQNLYLIRHEIIMPTFHKFPMIARNHILNSVLSDDNEKKPHCFLTRGIATHLPRNLNNQLEIEEYYKAKDEFLVLNPENITIYDLINIIRNVKILIITWGSALVNLMFLKPGTTVIILKSKSYEHESIELFRHIIDGLNLHVLIHENNIINIEKIENLL